MKSTYKGILIGLFIAGCLVGIGCLGYYYNKIKQEEGKLKPLTNEEIFHKYENSVVLIKHSFIYKISMLGQDFYFKDYNPITGEISKLISYDEAKINPNIIFGTGFFINKDGSVLTNRHIVDVKPSEEERTQILIGIRKRFIELLSLLHLKQTELREKLSYLDNQIYYADNRYDYSVLYSKYQEVRNEIEEVNYQMEIYRKLSDDFDRFNKEISKTSLQFGIFFNKQYVDKDLGNYIKYYSNKISTEKEVDLALLKPTNPNDLVGRKIVVADMSKIDSISIKPLKMTQKVIMIGYNRGADLGITTQGVKPQLTEGHISQLTDQYRMLYTIPTIGGSSGSPVFDEFGRVVGVNYASVRNTQSFNFGIQAEQIKKFLK